LALFVQIALTLALSQREREVLIAEKPAFFQAIRPIIFSSYNRVMYII